jgi:hypothetical protein
MKMRRKRYRVVLVGVPDEEMEQYEPSPARTIKKWWRLPDVDRWGWPLLLFSLWVIMGQVFFDVRFGEAGTLAIGLVCCMGIVWAVGKLVKQIRKDQACRT